MRFSLRVLLRSGSVVVRGGLGGTAPWLWLLVGCRKSGESFPRLSLPKSVGSGVYGEVRRLMLSSRLPTASLLWALEKVG
jgi:hypothetical protein